MKPDLKRKSWKALIVDDERLAREKLRSMLEAHPQIEIVGEANNAASALELIQKLKPELLFLDVQMPGESGFELVQKLRAPIKIVFVTAFDRYAIRAFEANAIDYLLKPVEAKRLTQTIGKLDELNAPPDELNAAKKEILEPSPLAYEDLLFVNVGSHLRFVRVNTIKLIAAADVYSEVHFSDGSKSLINKSLNNLAERLPGKYFLRIHRSTIVNVEYVERVESWFNHSFRVFLKDSPEPLIVSRRFSARLRSLMI